LAELDDEGIAHRKHGVISVSDPSRLFHPEAVRPTARDEAAIWKNLLGLSAAHRFDRGYTLFQQGDQPEDVYFIESGFVEFTASGNCAGPIDPSGARTPDSTCPVWWSSPGHVLGDCSALLGASHEVTAATRTRSTLCHTSAQSFCDSLEPARNSLLWHLLRAQSSDVRALTTNIVLTQTESLRHCLEDVLWRLAQQNGHGTSGDEVCLRDYSPQNSVLAGYVGTEERYISHLMHELKAKRIAWRGPGRLIAIRDCEKLFHAESAQSPIEVDVDMPEAAMADEDAITLFEGA
jgi:CRP-like cAMP-binding protein